MLWTAVACHRFESGGEPPQSKKEPQVRATVVTIRTTTQPANRTTTHALVIGDSVARTTEEAGVWKLYDFRRDRITFVDDADQTYRIVPLSSLVEDRRALLARELRPGMAPATWSNGGAERSIAGVTARQSLIRLGRYQRELWIATHPKIPPNVFAMMVASNHPESSVAPLLRDLDESLLAIRGFPFEDKSELPYGKDGRIVVERVVQSVEQKDVPQSLLTIPREYQEVKVPVVRRPRVSSRPSSQKTPAAVSPPSATTQTTP